MQVENIANLSHKVDLEVDESVLLHIFIAGLDDKNVQTVNDLLALLVSYCCEHCTDHMIDPTGVYSEEQQQQLSYANMMNSRYQNVISQD